jgi:hypothetical protein
MPSRPLEDIQDAELRELVREAQTALDADQYLLCVRRCADAYLLLLNKEPRAMNALRAVLATEAVRAGLENQTIRFAPVMWPRLAAKLRVCEDGRPEIVFDRERISFTEAMQYFEFTLNLIVDIERGDLTGLSSPAL